MRESDTTGSTGMTRCGRILAPAALVLAILAGTAGGFGAPAWGLESGGLLAGFEPSPAQVARERGGEVTVQVRGGGAVQTVQAQAWVQAPAPVVWAVLTDYASYPRLFSGIERSSTRSIDGSLQHCTVVKYPWPLPERWVCNIIRMDQRHWTIRWHRVSGTIRKLVGEWQLRPQGQATVLRYGVQIDPGLPVVPAWVAQWATRIEAPDILHAVAREAVLRFARERAGLIQPAPEALLRQGGGRERSDATISFRAVDLGTVFRGASRTILGLDGAFSTPVGRGRALWVFGDTLIGSWTASGDRGVTRMPSSTGAFVEDPDWRDGFEHAQFVGGDRPRSLLAPAPGSERVWPLDWVRSRGKLELYYVAIARTGNGALDFEVLGSGLARASGTDPLRFVPGPLMWRHGAPAFGGSALEHGGWLYVYAPGRPSYLARVRPAQVGDVEAYRYWAGQGRWTRAWKDGRTLPNSGAEASVRWDDYLNLFVMIDVGLAKTVRVRFAPEPWGPWTAPREVCPCQAATDAEAMCYGGKQHSELDRDDGREIFVTYNTNVAPAEIDRRSDLYWPHLVRIRFGTAASR